MEPIDPKLMAELATNLLKADELVAKYERIIENPTAYDFELKVYTNRTAWNENPIWQEIEPIISARLEQSKQYAAKLRAEYESHYK